MEIEKPFLVYRVLFLLYYKTLRLCYSSDYFAAGWKKCVYFSSSFRAARTTSGFAGIRVTRAPVALKMALRMAG